MVTRSFPWLLGAALFFCTAYTEFREGDWILAACLLVASAASWIMLLRKEERLRRQASLRSAEVSATEKAHGLVAHRPLSAAAAQACVAVGCGGLAFLLLSDAAGTAGTSAALAAAGGLAAATLAAGRLLNLVWVARCGWSLRLRPAGIELSWPRLHLPWSSVAGLASRSHTVSQATEVRWTLVLRLADGVRLPAGARLMAAWGGPATLAFSPRGELHLPLSGLHLDGEHMAVVADAQWRCRR